MPHPIQKRQMRVSVEYVNHPSKKEARTSAVTGRKLYGLVGVCFGLLCVLQAALNISLRLSLYFQASEEKLCKIARETDELRNLTDDYFQQGWVYFRPSFYYISTTKKSWQESRDDCVHRGADLMVIDSKAEQDFSSKLFKKMWIGLTYGEEEGTWKWVDGMLLNESYWMEGEPNNHQGREENCVEINFGEMENSWNDFDCDGLNFWICEDKIYQ